MEVEVWEPVVQFMQMKAVSPLITAPLRIMAPTVGMGIRVPAASPTRPATSSWAGVVEASRETAARGMVQEAEEEGRVAMVVRAAELTVRQAAEVEVVAAPFFQALTALRPAPPEAAGRVMA